MDKKGKSAIIFGLIAVLALAILAVIGIAHTNPQGKPTHLVGIETDSCQDAYAGAEEQLQDRGDVNPRLLDNIEDKCGFEFDENCSIEFDVANEPHLVCEEECVEIPPEIPIDEGDCGDLSFIEEANLPQCCTEDKPERNCGADAEWVVGFAISPGCFIPNS